MLRLLRAKLGLTTEAEHDQALFDAMFAAMQRSHVDFTQFFRALGDVKADDATGDTALRDMFIERDVFDAWVATYRTRLRSEHSDDVQRRAAMNAVNPKYVLRNYLAQVAIEKAQQGDFSEVTRLLAVLEQPFDDQPGHWRRQVTVVLPDQRRQPVPGLAWDPRDPRPRQRNM